MVFPILEHRSDSITIKRAVDDIDLDSLLKEFMEPNPVLPNPKLSPLLEDLPEPPKREERTSLDALGIDFYDYKTRQLEKYQQQQIENALVLQRIKEERKRKEEENKSTENEEKTEKKRNPRSNKK